MKKLLFLFVILISFSFVPVSYGAIAFDAATNDQAQSGSGTLNFSHTTTGANRFLTVACWWGGGANTISVTYNGVSMTRFIVPIGTLAYFGLANPASGTNTVAVSHTASIFCAAASYTGALQTNYENASTTQTGSGTSESNTVNTTVDNSWVIAAVYQDGTDTGGLTAASGTVLRATAATGFLRLADSNTVKHPAGAWEQVWNALGTGTANWADYAFGLSPAVTTTPVARRKPIMIE